MSKMSKARKINAALWGLVMVVMVVVLVSTWNEIGASVKSLLLGGALYTSMCLFTWRFIDLSIKEKEDKDA